MSAAPPALVRDPRYDSLGGWLVLVAIGVIFNPVGILGTLIQDLLPVFSGESWAALTTPGAEAYHPRWAPLLVYELVGNILLLAASVVVAVAFFGRKKSLPTLMIGLLLLNLAFLVGDHLLAQPIPALANANELAVPGQVIGSLVACCLWIPYFLSSKRVAGTFVR